MCIAKDAPSRTSSFRSGMCVGLKFRRANGIAARMNVVPIVAELISALRWRYARQWRS
jgi:hypothetical protein